LHHNCQQFSQNKKTLDNQAHDTNRGNGTRLAVCVAGFVRGVYLELFGVGL